MLARQPAYAPARGRSPVSGSKTGRVQRCSVCGEIGHFSDGMGRCSAAYLAQRMVERGCTVAAAAREYGISRQTLTERMQRAAKLRTRTL